MLAELLQVSVRVVRRWHRAGLLKATKEVLQLPYFDYSQLATARQLADWMRQGATVHSIQHQIEALHRRVGGSTDGDRQTFQQLPITAEGKRLVLRDGDFFVEASGQFRFGFESTAEEGHPDEPPATVLFRQPPTPPEYGGAQHDVSSAGGPHTLEHMIREAIVAEDEDDLETAIDWYRAALAAFGTNPDVCFQLAEVLYRQGDLHGARERYFMALELNPGLVEARANLGCVLAECGQRELAVAAFEGTLEQFADYADVHFHLARTLDDLGQESTAALHWQRFLELAPASPWAEEAEHRLSRAAPLLEL